LDKLALVPSNYQKSCVKACDSGLHGSNFGVKGEQQFLPKKGTFLIEGTHYSVLKRNLPWSTMKQAGHQGN
jgi:hypothetical protein